MFATRVAVLAATSGRARNFSAQTGANTAITAVSELVLANFSAVVRLTKPKPYESSIIPTTTPPAPVHRVDFTTSQLILIGCSSGLRQEVQRTHIYRAESEQNCSVPEEPIRKDRRQSRGLEVRSWPEPMVTCSLLYRPLPPIAAGSILDSHRSTSVRGSFPCALSNNGA